MVFLPPFIVHLKQSCFTGSWLVWSGEERRTGMIRPKNPDFISFVDRRVFHENYQNAPTSLSALQQAGEQWAPKFKLGVNKRSKPISSSIKSTLGACLHPSYSTLFQNPYSLIQLKNALNKYTQLHRLLTERMRRSRSYQSQYSEVRLFPFFYLPVGVSLQVLRHKKNQIRSRNCKNTPRSTRNLASNLHYRCVRLHTVEQRTDKETRNFGRMQIGTFESY